MIKFSALLALVTFSALADAPIGREIRPYQDDSDGRMRFGIQYGSASSFWTTTFTVFGPELTGGRQVRSIQVALYDSSRQQMLTRWMAVLSSANGITLPSSYAIQFGADDAAAPAVIAAQRTLEIVIAVDAPVGTTVMPTHHLSVGPLCLDRPGLFFDLDRGVTGC